MAQVRTTTVWMVLDNGHTLEACVESGKLAYLDSFTVVVRYKGQT